MNNHRCAVCDHVNRLGAEVCEMCDSRLDGTTLPDAEYASSSNYYDEEPQPRTGALPTDIPSPHFQGVGDVFAPTLQAYGKNFLLVGALVLATTILPSLIYVGFVRLMQTGTFSGLDGDRTYAFSILGPAIISTAVYWILDFIAGVVLAGALAYAVVDLQRTGTASVVDSLRWGLRKAPKVLCVSVISQVIYLSPLALAVGSMFILGAFGYIVLLLMVLPCIFLMLTFSMSMPAAAIENRGIFESLSRSAELTRGFKGLLFLTYFLWWLLKVVLNLIVSGSFAYSRGFALPGLVFQMLISSLLDSSMAVLTIYIFLGIIKERRPRTGWDAYAPGRASAAR